ncbi:MAG: PIG-L family deacetylase [Candidatus Aminicenantes bacterium]|nr:PIG-L family deacetylase [Candidatus Aminicenantes bacterium]
MNRSVLSGILDRPRPVRLDEAEIPPGLRILVLGPHPDDFDAAGVTLRLFRERGCRLRLLVLSSSANGVEDSFCSPPTPEAKAACREEEQRRSLRFFGLPAGAAEFLRLPVGPPEEGGYLLDDPAAFEAVKAGILADAPDLVFLPHGNDTNPDHRLTCFWRRRIAREASKPMAAMLIRDPKTVSSRDDAFVPFGEEAARWKAELLRFHLSQHRRNLHTRGTGFDDRILGVNRASAARLGLLEPYAEAFEVEFSPRS